jgi:hypothetical protein
MALSTFSSAFAQTYDISLKNKIITSDSTLEFDITIRNNNNAEAWGLRAFQCGYKFDDVFVDGGTLSCQYLQGSSELDSGFRKNWAFSWSSSLNIINQSSNVGNICPGAIVSGTERRIGRFKVTNNKKWGCGKDSITIMTIRKGSHLILNVTRYGDINCGSPSSPRDITSGASILNVFQPDLLITKSCKEYLWNGNTLFSSGLYIYDPTGCPEHKDSLQLEIDTVYRWTGALSRAWNEPANWSCGTVPDSFSSVLIPGNTENQPEIIGYEAFCRKIEFEPGAGIRIAAGSKLHTGSD